MSFQPKLGEKISINGMEYVWTENPELPGMIIRREGTESFLYALQTADERGDERRALKVFLRHYRTPSIVSQLEQLRALMDIQGLQAANRIILVPQEHMELLGEYRDLMYAVVMPWIDGPLWQDIVREKREIGKEQAWTLAKALAETLTALEQRSVAHCRLSAANLLLPYLHPQAEPATHPIELVDLEHMYHPAWKTKDMVYDVQWGPLGDRFSGGLLLVEILGWIDPAIRQLSREKSFFFPQEYHKEGERYKRLRISLQRNWGEPVARLFERIWESRTAEQFPSMGEWLIDLCEAKPMGGTGLALQSPPKQEIAAEPFQEIKQMLVIEPAELFMQPGESKELKAYRLWIDGKEEELSDQVQWVCDSPGTLELTAQGKVTALAPGVGRVWAIFAGQRADLLVSVARQGKDVFGRFAVWDIWDKYKRNIQAGAIVVLAVMLTGTLAFSMINDESPQATGKQETAEQEKSQDQKTRPISAAKQNGMPGETKATPTKTPAASPADGASQATDPANAAPVGSQPGGSLPKTVASQSGGSAFGPASGSPPAQVKAGQAAATAPTSAPRPSTPAKKPAAKKQTVQKQPAKQTKPAVKQKTPPKPTATLPLAPKEQGGKWGFIRKGTGFENDQVVIPFQFDYVTPFSQGFAMVKKDGKFGYINTSGKLAIPIQYDYATPFANGKATVKLNGVIGQIDQYGTFVK